MNDYCSCDRNSLRTYILRSQAVLAISSDQSTSLEASQCMPVNSALVSTKQPQTSRPVVQGYQARPRDFEEEVSEAVVSIGLAVI